MNNKFGVNSRENEGKVKLCLCHPEFISGSNHKNWQTD
jgi:hypothetical protein